MSIITKLLPLVPYAMDLAGGICIAWPWLEDQRLKSLIDDGNALAAEPNSVMQELGAVLQKLGLKGLLAIDAHQQRIVKTGIGLLIGSFVIRLGAALLAP
jgi:hypothetical protein